MYVIFAFDHWGGKCWGSREYPSLYQARHVIHAFMSSYIPLSCLCTFNAIIIYKLYQGRWRSGHNDQFFYANHCCLESRDILNENPDMSNKKKVERQRTATKILVVISMAFIFLTVPPTVVNIFYKKARQDRVFNKTEAYAYFNAIFWTVFASMNKYIYIYIF